MRRKKRKKGLMIFLMIAIIYTLILSVGVSLFSENIDIEGEAGSTKFTCNNTMVTSLTKLDTANNRYVIGGLPPRVIIESELLHENELTLNYRATSPNSPANRSTTLEFEIVNMYPFLMTSGAVSVTYSSENTNLYNVTPALSLNTVNIGSTVRVSVNFFTRLNQLTSPVSATIRVRYIVNTCDKYFYFKINLLPQQ